jgi:hypothetical protein
VRKGLFLFLCPAAGLFENFAFLSHC